MSSIYIFGSCHVTFVFYLNQLNFWLRQVRCVIGLCLVLSALLFDLLSSSCFCAYYDWEKGKTWDLEVLFYFWRVVLIHYVKCCRLSFFLSNSYGIPMIKTPYLVVCVCQHSQGFDHDIILDCLSLRFKFELPLNWWQHSFAYDG